MEAIRWIIERLNWLSEYFYDIYLEVNSWVAPFNYAAYLFYFISSVFSQLAWDFYDFSKWVGNVTDKVALILSWTTIWSYILSYVPNLELIRDWFYVRWSWFNTQVTNWWSETSSVVVGWIDAAKDWTKLWLDYLEGRVNELTSSWNTFITVTLPTLPNWLDIDALIKSWFANFSPLWEGWQELRDKVAEFFSDPEDWLYKAADRIVERFW